MHAFSMLVIGQEEGVAGIANQLVLDKDQERTDVPSPTRAKVKEAIKSERPCYALIAGGTSQEITEELRRAKVQIFILSATHYGSPQEIDRGTIVCNEKDFNGLVGCISNLQPPKSPLGVSTNHLDPTRTRDRKVLEKTI